MCSGVQGHVLGAGQVGVGAQAVALLAAGTSVASAPPHARLHCKQRNATSATLKAAASQKLGFRLLSCGAISRVLSYRHAVNTVHAMCSLPMKQVCTALQPQNMIQEQGIQNIRQVWEATSPCC